MLKKTTVEGEQGGGSTQATHHDFAPQRTAPFLVEFHCRKPFFVFPYGSGNGFRLRETANGAGNVPSRSELKRMKHKVFAFLFAFSLVSFTLFSWKGRAQTLPPLEVAASTAYSEPTPEGIEITETGAAHWSDPKQSLVFYGWAGKPGKYTFGLRVRLPKREHSRIQFRAEGKNTVFEIEGNETWQDLPAAEVFLRETGYHAFFLTGLKKTGGTFGEIALLRIGGEQIGSLHFNREVRRNAASVHLGYPTPPEAHLTAFYNEVTVKTDPIWSYYMACGFARGYFGIQVNSPTERRIIFSVWDSGQEPDDPAKVRPEDRIQLLDRGAGVFTDRFGSEGTGGHSHLVYPWKTGATYRFCVTAQPDGTHTIYAGYFYFPEKKRWELIAKFRAPQDGGFLRGLYSFNENFGGANGQKLRLAEFGNEWIRGEDGTWNERTEARFTHDPTGKIQRKDYNAGTVKGRFFLENGGFRCYEKRKYGDKISRPAGRERPPRDFVFK